MDVIAGDSTQTRYFIKVSTIDEKRIGHELIKTQWDGIDSDEEDEDSVPNSKKSISLIPIAVMAQQLLSAAQAAGSIPIFVLSSLERDHDHGLFAYFDSIGLQYYCRSDTGPILNYAPGVPYPSSPNAPRHRIALDITTLLSMIADVCNMPPYSIQYDRNPRAQVEQVESEAASPSLTSAIFPYLQTADELIAPQGVVSKINTLLETIGSETEKRRAAILFGKTGSPERLVDQWSNLTIYTPPTTLPLPVHIVPVDEPLVSSLTAEDSEKLSAEAIEMYNLAISYPGGCEVATANKQLAKMIRAYYFVEQNSIGVSGRVLLHQPRSLRGYGKIVFQHKGTA